MAAGMVPLLLALALLQLLVPQVLLVPLVPL
jgi:hypothetical protein